MAKTNNNLKTPQTFSIKPTSFEQYDAKFQSDSPSQYSKNVKPDTGRQPHAHAQGKPFVGPVRQDFLNSLHPDNGGWVKIDGIFVKGSFTFGGQQTGSSNQETCSSSASILVDPTPAVSTPQQVPERRTFSLLMQLMLILGWLTWFVLSKIKKRD